MKVFVRFCVSATLLAVIAGASFAQGPGGAAGGAQFAQFREQHKYTFQLTQMVRHIGDIDRDKKHALTPAQAKKVLAVLKPLRSKPNLTQDQAKKALKDLKVIFTVDQLNAMAKIKAPPRPSGMRPGGGPPGASAGGAQGGGRTGGTRMNPAAMKNFNPFYTKVNKADPRSARSAKRWNDFFSKLEAKSKNAKATPAKPAKAATSKAKPKK